MSKMAIFIDGGHINHLFKDNFVIDNYSIDYEKFIKWISGTSTILRAYYYDCLPYQSPEPTPRERKFISKKQKFFFSLEKIPRFCVRQGKLAYRGKDNDGKPIFIQKRIDLLLGLDLGSLVSTRKVDEVAIVAGDSDFIPVVEFAKKEGVIVWLIHGPFGTYHKDLWQATDERKEITQEIVNNVISLSANNNEKTAI